MKLVSSLIVLVGLISIAQGSDQFLKDNLLNQERPNEQPEEDEPILVHIVPHSFNQNFFDMVDHYFPDKQQELLQDHFDKVFDQVFKALKTDSSRSFSHFEVKFFASWYYRQTPETQKMVKGFVARGLFEFVTGGWDMHDEACPTYQDMLMNIQKGHLFLMQEFQDKPRVAWSIDQSGHSQTHARLLAESGIEALYLLNIDPEDRQARIKDREMEFIWRPSLMHLGRKTELLTHIIYDFNTSPLDLPLFDRIDNRNNSNSTNNSSPPENNTQPEQEDQGEDTIDEDIPGKKRLSRPTRMQTFRSYIEEMSKVYKTKHLILMVGSNINYEKAEFYYEELSDIIMMFNIHNQDMKLMFSNLYFYSMSVGDHNKELPTNYFDMMPYMEKGNMHFTGLFTSRPMLKNFIRQGSSMWHAANKLYFNTMMHPQTNNNTFGAIQRASYFLSDAVCTAQSPDIITGTCRTSLAQQVTDKLEDNMEDNFARMAFLMDGYAQTLAGIQSKDHKWEACIRFNITSIDCPILYDKENNKTVLVSTFNPSLQSLTHVKFPVVDGHYEVQVFNETSKKFHNTEATVLCQTEETSKQHCLIFVDINIGGQQIGLITLKRNTSIDLVPEVKINGTFRIENNVQYLQYKQFSEEDGAIFLIQKKVHMDLFHVGFDLRYYHSYQGFVGTRSGAAIFRPDSNESFRYSNLTRVNYQQGSSVSQINLYYRDRMTGENAIVSARIYKDSSMIEWDIFLGGIPVNNNGKEVTVNFKSLDIDNRGRFETDSNGLEMLSRWLNYRPTYIYNKEQSYGNSISSNYYPVTSAIVIRSEDDKNQMTVMTGRTQGGSVIKTGRIELMHNRRLLRDDRATKEIVLNETHPYGKPFEVRGSYFLQIFERSHEKSQQRAQQALIDEPAQLFFSFDFKQNSSFIKNNSQPLSSYQELAQFGLPPNAKVQYQALNQTSFYIRLENLDDLFDNENAVTPFITIQNLVQHIHSKIYGGVSLNGVSLQIKETSLTGNQRYTSMVRDKTKWAGVDDDYVDETELPIDKGTEQLSLEPQRIRAFMVTITPLVPPKQPSSFIE